MTAVDYFTGFLSTIHFISYDRGGRTGPADPVLARPLSSHQVINIHKPYTCAYT